MRKKNRKRIRRIWLIMTGIFLFLLLSAAVGFMILRILGERRVRNNTRSQAPQMTYDTMGIPAEGESERPFSSEWKEGWISHEDKVYEYNEAVLTFLIMGIDKSGEVQTAENGLDGGQADAIFLAALNPKDRRADLIAINRDTMTDVAVYDFYGGYSSTVRAQLALQHAYGDGKEKSAEYMVQAVSDLMYQLPIHGYAAINMEAIPLINDGVGGVEVTCLQDLTRLDASLKEGETVRLMGKTAFWYVKYRDVTAFESNRDRLARQKQYLGAFADRAAEALKENSLLPVELYRKLTPYMITDLTVDGAAYLASEAIPCMGDIRVHTLEGKTVKGALYEEFYPDEEALCDLILDVFYKEVNLQTQTGD